MLDVAEASRLKLKRSSSSSTTSGSGPSIRVHSGFTRTQLHTAHYHPTEHDASSSLPLFCCELLPEKKTLRVPMFALTTKFVEDFGKQ